MDCLDNISPALLRGFLYLYMFVVWRLLFGVCGLVFGVWCLVFGVWCLVFKPLND
jgi:hypothetical protein